jgi:hypothetical protein
MIDCRGAESVRFDVVAPVSHDPIDPRWRNLHPRAVSQRSPLARRRPEVDAGCAEFCAPAILAPAAARLMRLARTELSVHVLKPPRRPEAVEVYERGRGQAAGFRAQLACNSGAAGVQHCCYFSRYRGTDCRAPWPTGSSSARPARISPPMATRHRGDGLDGFEPIRMESFGARHRPTRDRRRPPG